MKVTIEAGWQEALADEFERPYFHSLVEFVRHEYTHERIYPPGRQIFSAFDLCPLDQTRVIILGQDPYHGPGQAHGLAFSVAEGVPPPPSLENIFREVTSDVGTPHPGSGNLERWARQGVLLLNTVLTVRHGQANSHKARGWELFTDAVIRVLNEKKTGVVFILWGTPAHKKAAFVDPTRHKVLKSVHPSPLAAHGGFFGSKPFSQANEYLSLQGQPPISW